MDFYGKWLVETEWLAEHLEAPDIVILDCTLYLPIEDRDAAEEYLEEHIPGALRFDIDEIADTGNPLPHMLPNPEKFASRVREMGIGDGTRVICYDRQNVYSASRAWWMFRVMGHEDVAVLNGGINKWRAEKRPRVEGEPQQRTGKHFTPRCNSGLVRDLNDMKRIVAAGVKQVVDARTAGRFAGTEPEPRKVPRVGHIPGSISLPYQKLLRGNGTLKAPDELREVFAAAGVDAAQPVVATCGSGVTACVIALALACLGEEQCAVYDGSWTEWAGADVPAEAG